MRSTLAAIRQRREERKTVLGLGVEAVAGSKESRGRALLARRHALLLADAKALLKLTSEQVHSCLHSRFILDHYAFFVFINILLMARSFGWTAISVSVQRQNGMKASEAGISSSRTMDRQSHAAMEMSGGVYWEFKYLQLANTCLQFTSKSVRRTMSILASHMKTWISMTTTTEGI